MSFISNSTTYELEKHWAVQKFTSAIGPGECILCIVQTLREARERDDKTWQKISDSEVEKLALAINKIIGKKFYGKIYRRFKKIPPVLWGHEGKIEDIRNHLNLTIAVPEWMPIVEAMSIIEEAFDSMSWSKNFKRSIDIAYNLENWALYSIKEYDSLLLEACNFEPNILPRNCSRLSRLLSR